MARAAKKDKFHSEAPDDVIVNLDNVIEKYHKELGDSNFLILFKHGGWKSKGKTVFGGVSILADAFRVTMEKDVILFLNADMWTRFSPPQKNYLLDHFMYQLDTTTDRHGSTKYAMDGRPSLTKVPHDIEAYIDVVKRHGVVMEDVKRLASAMKETNQITIEDVVKDEPKEDPPKGIEYRLDGSEVIIDKDQAELVLEEGTLKTIETLDSMDGIANTNVVDMKTRSPRVTKTEKEAAKQTALTQPENPDDLPF
jgi:hypothetical protein